MTNKNGAISRAMPIAPEHVEQPDAVQPYLTAPVLSFGKQLISSRVADTHKGQNDLSGLVTQIQRGVTSCRRQNNRMRVLILTGR